MANINNSISLQDKMTPVLSQIIRSLDLTVKAMKSVSAESNKVTQQKAFNAANNAIKQANNSLDKMVSEMKQAKNVSGDVNVQFQKWPNSIMTAASALQIIRSGLGALRQGFGILQSFNEAAYGEDAAQTRLASQLRNVVRTREEGIRAQAEINRLAQEGERRTVVAGTASVAGASQLATYGLQAQSIQKLLPALRDLSVGMYGVNVSEEQMISTAQLFGKVLNGQTAALTRYGIKISEVQKKILETGNETEKTEVLVKLLGNSFGGLAENMAQSSAGARAQFQNVWQHMMEEIGKTSANAFGNVYRSIIENLPKIQAAIQQLINMVVPLINWIATTGIPLIVSGLDAIMPIITTIYNFIANNFGWIEPLVSGIGASLLTLATILGTVAMVTKLVTAATWLLNIALNANPIVLVITLIAGLIVWLVRLWKTNDTFRINIIKAWNFIKDGILDAVAMIKIMVMKAFQGMVNFAIGQVNMLISAVNKIPGVDIPLLEKTSFGDKVEEEELAKYIKRKDERKAENAALDAELEASKARKAQEAVNGPAPSGAEALWGSFKGPVHTIVDEIKDEVKIGEDDIKYLKDVAMKDFDVRYQQVTPSVTISNMNVAETADVDVIAGTLEKMINEAQSADVNVGIAYGS